MPFSPNFLKQTMFSNPLVLSPQHEEKYNVLRCAEEVAAATGRVVVKSDDLELQIDIDSREAYTLHIQSLRSLYSSEVGNILIMSDSLWEFPSDPWRELPLPIPGHMVLASQTEDHYHIYLALTHPLSQAERINLQFILGSDPGRESLNTKRLYKGDGDAGILFFETPADAQRVLWWRGLTNNLRKKQEKMIHVG